MNLEIKLSTENQNISEIHRVAEKIKHISSKQKCKISSERTVLIISPEQAAFVPGELLSVMIILYH